MKTQFVLLVAIAFAEVAQAGPGPISPLYLTYVNGGPNIVVVQGNSLINTFPEAYGSPFEIPIAVYGDVRTTGFDFSGAGEGGQYTLSGIPTGTSYVLPAAVAIAYDSTSDGSHNYLVDWNTGTVYQTARDFTNPTALFTAPGGLGAWLGVTYDAANKSLWISSWSGTTVADYSLSGTLLSSFSTGHVENAALALDPADHTLWLIDDQDRPNYLEQYSTAGVLLSTGSSFGTALGGEFNLAPEPGTLIMFGSGILGLAGLLRRKINL